MFITATDTDAGKTFVSRLIVEALRAEGVDAVGYKPVSCGDRDDARVLAEVSGGIDLDEVNPVALGSALAPYVASMLEGRPVEREELINGYRALAAKHQVVVVEGCGGWEVPIAPGYAVSDLAADLDLPVVLVVANKLGALNHTILTVKSMKARGVKIAGLIINQLEDEMDTVQITNKGVIEDLTGVPILTHIIHGQDFLDVEDLRPAL